MINDLGFTKNAAILNELVSQVTGVKTIAPINREQFVAVAQTALKSGFDPLLNSISYVLGRTVFSVRPYNRKFGRLQVSNQQYGDMQRKLSMLDSTWDENPQYHLEDEKSYDMYKIKKEKVLQTNFYGFQTYSRKLMIWYNQLDVAFSGYEEFQRFMGMKLQNLHDEIEQGHEAFARGAVTNLAGGVLHLSGANTGAIHPERVIHLVQEYNAYAGTTLTATDVIRYDNIKEFAMWFYARFGELIRLLSERSVMFHQNPVAKTVLARHSAMSDLHVYMFSPFMTLMDTMVHSEIFHNEYLKFVDYETVSFWQDIANDANPTGFGQMFGDRSRIQGKVAFMSNDGTMASVELEKTEPIVGILFDRDACGYTVFDTHSSRTPWNSEGDYAITYYKYTNRYWNDYTENAVVLMLD